MERRFIPCGNCLSGSYHLYVLYNPLEKSDESSKLPDVIDWDFAQKELAKGDGVDDQLDKVSGDKGKF